VLRFAPHVNPTERLTRVVAWRVRSMFINMIALIIVTVFGGLVYFGLERKTARGGAAGSCARMCRPHLVCTSHPHATAHGA
jgi:hypothetical protein